MRQYYVSRDVEADLLSKRPLWPKDWKNIHVYNDEIEIVVSSPVNKQKEAQWLQVLKEWFSSRIQGKEFLLNPIGERQRILTFSFSQEDVFADNPNFKPSFRSFYRGVEHFPEPFQTLPIMIAFHSYKGGVGRTLSALSLCRCCSRVVKNGKPPQLLIIDADFEAPGLTWLARKKKSGFNDFSLMDVLALIQENKQWDGILDYVASKIQEETLRLSVNGIETEHYFLPAYRDELQLLMMPVSPADLIQYVGKEWTLGDFFYSLGKKLSVDAVIMDLRAGISEYSAPFLFDPRFQRILVTTTSLQSTSGTELVLKNIGERMPANKDDYPVPYVFISMITDEAKDKVGKISVQMMTAYADKQSDAVLSNDEYAMDYKGVNVVELPFAEELVHIEDLDQMGRKLEGTPFEKEIEKTVAQFFIPQTKADRESVGRTPNIKNRNSFLGNLYDNCYTMEYAENTDVSDYLITVPIRNLAQKFAHSVPTTVVMGAKGSGKTFIYLQVVKKKRWNAFTQKIVDKTSQQDALILPLLSSAHLKNNNVIDECIRENLNLLGTYSAFSMREVKERIEQNLRKDLTESSWQRFWLNEMANMIGLQTADNVRAQDIENYLKQKNQKVVFVIDGLEDVFSKVSEDEAQQIAIKALCQGLTSEIRDIQQSHLGLIVFVRKDMVRQSILQNFGQFSRLYEPYELLWNHVEALRLALWICRKTDPEWKIQGNVEDVELLNRELIEKSLLPLWGLKLGKDNSKEAYTANWVVGALSDYRGQLQARDIVRFLRQSSHIMLNQNISITYSDRYLQPIAIRQAIDYCSVEKVKETREEIKVVDHIFQKIERAPDSGKEIPFEWDALKLTPGEVKILEELGIIYKQEEGYFMPEIFRRGLKFKLRRGARPKVINLMKNALKEG